MPKLGLTMTEGTLSAWSVKAGDMVKAGDILFVVETDKIANEVEARDDGTILTIEVAAGETVPVGGVLAIWTGPSLGANPDEEMQAGLPPLPVVSASIPAIEAEAPASPPAAGDGRHRSTPLARRMAREAGIDLSEVRGGGPRGRIKAADVERYCATSRAPIPVVSHHARAASETRRPATSIERTIARRLTESKQTIPHFYVLADADVSALLDLRKQLNATGPKAKISVNHCIVAAAARALQAVPELNAIWQEGEIVQFAGIDIGVAVDSPRGLLVPVLRDLGGLLLPLLAERADLLVARARDGKLDGPDMAGGALTVSNVGMYGASFLVPIINPGQSAILGVGAPRQVFRPDVDGKPALRTEIGLVLSCDHRTHDGVRAAMLLDAIVKVLENPLRLLMP
jgi:pyruvate dehydrogenase E2 component (dihydrolipoamide acetyltransferase)